MLGIPRPTHTGLFFVLCGSLFLLSGCFSSDTTPRSRIHNAATVPRLVDLDPGDFSDKGHPSPVGINLGAGYGIGFTDSGNVVGGEIVHLGIHVRTQHFAIGIVPYYANASTSLEGTGMFGIGGFTGIYFGGKDVKVSLQGSITTANKVNSETGCADAQGSFQICTGKATSTVRSQTKVVDSGATLTFDVRVSDQSSMFLAPSLYYTTITTGNQLDVAPAGDYALSAKFLSPGATIGYVGRSGKKFHTMTSIMAGAHSVRTFRKDLTRREIVPTMDIRFQF